MIRSATISAAVFAALSAHAQADAVDDMCRDSASNTAEQCDCATAALRAELSQDDYVLYEAVGARYLDARAQGQRAGDAWDSGVRAEASARGAGFATTMSRLNEIGGQHRDAIRTCES